MCAVVALLSAGAGAAAARAGDGGSATYTSRGTAEDFVLANTGTTRWQYFALVGPAGTTFIGGSAETEATVACSVGPPARLVCGPTTVALGARLGFTAFVRAAVPCGASFQLWVSSTDAQSLTQVGDAVYAGSCAPPRVVRGAVVRRRGSVVTLTPPVWSETPVGVVYRWQHCTTACVTLPHSSATRIRSRAAVRAVVTAVFSDGARLRSVSAKA